MRLVFGGCIAAFFRFCPDVPSRKMHHVVCVLVKPYSLRCRLAASLKLWDTISKTACQEEMKKNIESLQKGSKGHRDFSLRGWI